MSWKEVTFEDWKARGQENEYGLGVFFSFSVSHRTTGHLHWYVRYGGTNSWEKLLCALKPY